MPVWNETRDIGMRGHIEWEKEEPASQRVEYRRANFAGAHRIKSSTEIFLSERKNHLDKKIGSDGASETSSGKLEGGTFLDPRIVTLSLKMQNEEIMANVKEGKKKKPRSMGGMRKVKVLVNGESTVWDSRF